MTHDSRVNHYEKATNITNNNWETVNANFIAEILVSGIYHWREAAPTSTILKIQPQQQNAYTNPPLPTQIINP